MAAAAAQGQIGREEGRSGSGKGRRRRGVRWGGLGRGGARHGGEGWPESTGAANGGARLLCSAHVLREGGDDEGKMDLAIANAAGGLSGGVVADAATRGGASTVAAAQATVRHSDHFKCI